MVERSERIAFGKFVVKGTRIPLRFLIDSFLSAQSWEELLEWYPSLKEYTMEEFAKDLLSLGIKECKVKACLYEKNLKECQYIKRAIARKERELRKRNALKLLEHITKNKPLDKEAKDLLLALYERFNLIENPERALEKPVINAL